MCGFFQYVIKYAKIEHFLLLMHVRQYEWLHIFFLSISLWHIYFHAAKLTYCIRIEILQVYFNGAEKSPL